MKSKTWLIGGAIFVAFVLYYALFAGTSGGQEIEYRYAEIESGELIRSTSATGTLVPLTRVDVKSKAGGKVVQLAVDEGSMVKAGDLIALIDPEDTRSIYEQAQADVTSAQARVAQAQTNAELQALNVDTAVRDAEIQVEVAKLRLARAEQDYKAAPELAKAELQNAEASLQAAREALKQLKEVDIPQRRRDVEGANRRTKADLDAAEAEMTRQETLMAKGYVSQASVERARTALEAARASHQVASQRFLTMEMGFQSEIRAQEARVTQAEASYSQAKANQNRVIVSEKTLQESRNALAQAQLSLKRSQDDRLNVRVRQSDVQSATAGAVRSQVAMQNARVQLDSTTVVAPRDGVVTTKYLEEGTIIPPGTSTFAQGTSLVEISDVTTMFVECSVDETDIASVKLDQPVRIIVEAYPGQIFRGVVRKIFPAAATAQSLTTIKVRIELLKTPPTAAGGGRQGPSGAPGQGGGSQNQGGQAPQGRPAGGSGRPARPAGDPVLRPGMNATCEFLTMEKQDVVIVPAQAIQRDGDKTYVEVKSADPLKPIRREVKLGEMGNQGFEVIEGLKPGEEVVVAKIDLAALRERQERMEAQQQGGGLASGARGGPSPSRAGGTR